MKWVFNNIFMPIANRLENSAIGRSLGGHPQMKYDVVKVAWTQHYRNHYYDLLKESKKKNIPFVDNFEHEKEWAAFSRLSIPAQYRANKKNLNRQVNSLFEFIAKEDPRGTNPYPPIPLESEVKRFKQLSKNAKEKLDDRLAEEVYKEGPKIAHPDGFHLQIKKSKADHPDSGFGVFVEGDCPPGTLVGIYPGSLYTNSEFHDAGMTERMYENEYLVARYDDIIIDGRDWPLRSYEAHVNLSLLDLAGGQQSHDALRKFRNPFAIGNFINHPPSGTKPNVLLYNYEFLLEEENEDFLPKELRPFIPNEMNRKYVRKFDRDLYYIDGKNIPTVIAVALRHLKNEELFLDYRLNPVKSKTPEWYTHPNIEESYRRSLEPMPQGLIEELKKEEEEWKKSRDASLAAKENNQLKKE
eukprot:TRINITY_DN9043_c0_g1_i2.p1 TRINITY_DN9043_c0_g1~~TRINITY_DN9043_c0_g1_i2.p1  ORF type:complete len:423 (-),score=101.96 TRINITY_DN9043_c0_g1_i2:30-1265(-)